jgi:transglutaminase superfamily protein
MGLRPAAARARRALRLLTPANLRAAAWAYAALRRTSRSLARDGLQGAHVDPPPRLPASAGAGVFAVARRRPATCLERALVLQRWEAEHGDPADVLIGVRGASGDFRAHAWLETMPDAPPGAFEIIHRLPAPTS